MLGKAAPVNKSVDPAKRQEIEALYTAHNPTKLAEVDHLLAKYGENKLLTMVRNKYKR